ncbi:MAG: J domain-containing protein [Caldilineales bacterium]|nr:J domain-containing protein [Caldilineales bacterium]MCW5860959.1 J domain-containing protein [Caldilineales bacterium]
MKDYYLILQVHPQAEPEVIQAAYHRLARKHHPDAAGGADAAAMQELNEAYAVLSDPAQRARYDHSYAVPPPPPGRPTLPLWRALLPTALTLATLVVLLLDLFRLGVRGLPEITVVLVVVGWLVYHFSGLRERWRG